jgi:hypothetical protein
MQVGDTVRVRTNGRRALIVEELSRERFQVEFVPDPAGDPIDRDTVQDSDVGGIYAARELEPID